MITPLSARRANPADSNRQHDRVYSSQNLIVNGGFAIASAGGLVGWRLPAPTDHGPAWQRVATPSFDRAGLPLSAHALQATVSGEAGNTGSIWQDLELQHGFSGCYVLRLAARSLRGEPTFRVKIVADPSSSTPIVVAESFLDASSRWQRYRVPFTMDHPSAHPTLRIVIAGPEEPGSAAQFTDFRLVFVRFGQKPFPIRFDTRGDLTLPSSRLRAWLLEDYLHLLGWPISMNSGNSFALYVCQKVRPWSKRWRARWRRRTVVYDLDDNDLLFSAREAQGIRRFVRSVDGVTAGSEFLRRMLTPWNPHAAILENPVDVLDRDIVHGHDEWRGRVVWFGMPENLWVLRNLAIDRPVTTITQGGDIEYDLKTVDEQLVTFDLALLPVILNDETRAKNANRLVKCVGLGLPFLASDTPEHRRALERLQLSDIFIVTSAEEWSARIDDVAHRYGYYKRLVQDARALAFEIYGIERVAADWLAFCSELVAGAKFSASAPAEPAARRSV
ncbi:MAG TPA: hypothetical protein VKT80_19525 [Chloroflexota bacterium]|nr:hypothetical protein [Chloroflexota bacterium]